MYKTLYATDNLDLQKSDAQTRAMYFVKYNIDAATMKSLFSALYAPSGVDLPKKDAQLQAMQLSMSGANSTQLKLAYQGFKHMGKSQQDALQAATPEAILAGFNGLARRHATNDTVPYTASEFQKYYTAPYNWVDQWINSPVEERLANDHHAYDIAEFNKYYKDSWYWTQAKTATQRRLADDGKPYTMKEFYEYYGLAWLQFWYAAPVLACAECTSEALQEPLTINV